MSVETLRLRYSGEDVSALRTAARATQKANERIEGERGSVSVLLNLYRTGLELANRLLRLEHENNVTLSYELKEALRAIHRSPDLGLTPRQQQRWRQLVAEATD